MNGETATQARALLTSPMQFDQTEHAAPVPASATRAARLHRAHVTLVHSVVAFPPETKPLVETLSREVAPLK